ncbi:MAG: hypothetical protein WBM04_10855 [Candidatus Korobacteraceae bacterium]
MATLLLSACSKSLQGTYSSDQGESLVFHPDGKFERIQNGTGMAGQYIRDGADLTLRYDIGMVETAKISEDTVILNTQSFGGRAIQETYTRKP